MLLYETKGSLMSMKTTRPEETQIGKTYRVANAIERWVYKGSLNTYFKEYVYRNQEVYLMTKFDGTKPFAIATNDCARDGFDACNLSKIYVEVGHHIVYGYKSTDAKSYDPIQFIILQVSDLHPIDEREPMLEATAIHKFSSIDPFPTKFASSIYHAVDVIDCGLQDQVLPKYCFNPNRTITMRLFERNDRDAVESYLPNGQRLIMNANSAARYTDKGAITQGGLYRVFFSRKFQSSQVIYVDGTELEPLENSDLEKYVDKSYLDDELANSMIKKVTTYKGNEFYAIVNLNGHLRPLYKSTTGYLSFTLSKQELSFIKEVQDVELV